MGFTPTLCKIGLVQPQEIKTTVAISTVKYLRIFLVWLCQSFTFFHQFFEKRSPSSFPRTEAVCAGQPLHPRGAAVHPGLIM